MGLLNIKKTIDNNDVPTPNAGYGTFFIDNTGTPKIKDESGNILNFASGVSSINGESGSVNLKNSDLTQWRKNLGSVVVPNVGSYNIFDTLLGSDKRAVSSTDNGQVDITPDAGETFIMLNWQNVIEKISIRITMELQQGGTDFYRLQLRRKVDDSIISVHPFSMNAADQPEDIVTVNIETYMGSALDSFATDGFYILLVNDSGGSVTIANDIDILFERKYKASIPYTP